LVGASIFGASKLKLGLNPISFLPDENPTVQFIKGMNKTLGGMRYIEIMFSAEKEDGILQPELLKEMEKFQQYAETLPNISHAQSFVDVIKKINMAMNNNQPIHYSIPEKSDLIAQYLLLYSMSSDPSDFDAIIDADYQHAKILLKVNSNDNEVHKEIYNNLKGYVTSNLSGKYTIDFGGDIMFYVAFTKYVVQGKIQNMIFSIIIVFLFCAILFRAIPRGFVTILPLVVSTLLTFGFMGFMGIRLNFITALITSIAVGVGVDFAIHFMERLHDEYHRMNRHLLAATSVTIQTTGKAIVYDAASNILGFIVLVSSGFKCVAYFGWLVSMTMVTCCVVTLVLVPAVVGLLGPAWVFRMKPSTRAIKVPEPIPVVLAPETVEVEIERR
jgi:hypothetical protein